MAIVSVRWLAELNLTSRGKNCHRIFLWLRLILSLTHLQRLLRCKTKLSRSGATKKQRQTQQYHRIKEGEITVSSNYREVWVISGIETGLRDHHSLVFSWSVPFEILLYCLIVTPVAHFIASSDYSFAHEERISWNGGFWPKTSRYNEMRPYISHFSNPNQCFMRLSFSWPSGHIIYDIFFVCIRYRCSQFV